MSSYSEKYRERHKPEMADRQSYIHYLESQVEKASSSALLVQSLSESIDSIQSQLNTAEEKIVNLTRLVKLQQSYAESQEEELNTLKVRAEPKSNLEERVSALERKLQRECLEDRLLAVENQLPRSQERSSYSSFMQEVDKALKDTEQRINQLVRKTSEDIDLKHKVLQNKLEQAIDRSSREFTSEYRELNNKISKINEVGSLASFGKPEHFEEFFEESLRASNNEFQRANKRIAALEQFKTEATEELVERSKEVRQVADTAASAEQICAKLSEDALYRMAEAEKNIRDLQQFLLATAEEIKKIEGSIDPQKIENRVAERVGDTLEKVAGSVKNHIKSQEKLAADIQQIKARMKSFNTRNTSRSSRSSRSTNAKARTSPQRFS